MVENALSEIEILSQIMSMLAELDDDGRKRVLATIVTYYETSRRSPAAEPSNRSVSSQGQSFGPTTPYSERLDLSPKEFLRENTDVSQALEREIRESYADNAAPTTNGVAAGFDDEDGGEKT